MNLSNPIDILLAVLVVMALGALSGWFAGTAMYFIRRTKMSRQQQRDLTTHLIPGIASIVVFLAVLAPLFHQLGGNTFVVLGFLAMLIVPFSILGAQTAWLRQIRRQHARDKLKTVSATLVQLRTQHQSSRK